MSFQPISSQLTFCPTTPIFVSKVFTLSSPRKVKEIDTMVQALSKAPIKSSRSSNLPWKSDGRRYLSDWQHRPLVSQ